MMVKKHSDMFSHFNIVLAWRCHRQTDRQTDRQTSCDGTVRAMHSIAQ